MRLNIGNLGFLKREWILIYLEGMFTIKNMGYTYAVYESEFGEDELSFFMRDKRTRRVVEQQSICGRVQETGRYLISTYDAAAAVRLESSGGKY